MERRSWGADGAVGAIVGGATAAEKAGAGAESGPVVEEAAADPMVASVFGLATPLSVAVTV